MVCVIKCVKVYPYNWFINCLFCIFLVSPAGSVFISPQIENTFNGSTFNLTCNSRGGAFNHFHWTYLKTGEVVSNESVYELTSTVYTGGQYQCFVYNDAGNDTATVAVNSELLYTELTDY